MKYFQSSLILKGDIYFEKKMKVDMSGWHLPSYDLRTT